MQFNILALADIHWGAMEAQTLYDSLSFIPMVIQKMRGEIDLVVIAGDYFDYRLQLNSKSALLALKWFDELYQTCKDNEVRAIRAVRGTREHDNDQWEAFGSYVKPDGYFKFFNENTYEETLPGLTCIYCPDETINTKEYMEKYLSNIMRIADIGFFHGSFDIVLPSIVVQRSEETSAANIIYEYDVWSRLIRGPLISGHWHDGEVRNPLIYIGSPDCWSFGEEEPKGIGFIQYDTDTQEYLYKKIINPNATVFKTIRVDSSMFPTHEQYAELIEKIDEEIKTHPEQKLRVLFEITDEKQENVEYLKELKQLYASSRRVHLEIKDLIKKAKKKQQREKQEESSNQYNFITKALTPGVTIQEFIRIARGKEIPLDVIGKYINPYLPDGLQVPLSS